MLSCPQCLRCFELTRPRGGEGWAQQCVGRSRSLENLRGAFGGYSLSCAKLLLRLSILHSPSNHSPFSIPPSQPDVSSGSDLGETAQTPGVSMCRMHLLASQLHTQHSVAETCGTQQDTLSFSSADRMWAQHGGEVLEPKAKCGVSP